MQRNKQAPVFLVSFCYNGRAGQSRRAWLDKEGTGTLSTLGILVVTREAQGNDVRIMSSSRRALQQVAALQLSLQLCLQLALQGRAGESFSECRSRLGESRVLSPDWAGESLDGRERHSTGDRQQARGGGVAVQWAGSRHADVMLMLLLLLRKLQAGGGRRI